jgi:hypothetical protein
MAAEAHRQAAVQHRRGDAVKAHEHSASAQAHSKKAHEASGMTQSKAKEAAARR